MSDLRGDSLRYKSMEFRQKDWTDGVCVQGRSNKDILHQLSASSVYGLTDIQYTARGRVFDDLGHDLA